MFVWPVNHLVHCINARVVPSNFDFAKDFKNKKIECAWCCLQKFFQPEVSAVVSKSDYFCRCLRIADKGAVRSAAANDASVAMQNWYLEMGSNRQASDIWFNAMTSPEPLSTHDEFQFLMSMHAVLLGMQNSYLLSQEGTLDAEFREAVTTALVAVKDLPGMDRYWRQRRGFFHSGFAKYVDGLLDQDATSNMP
jgi:hypothetical protein